MFFGECFFLCFESFVGGFDGFFYVGIWGGVGLVDGFVGDGWDDIVLFFGVVFFVVDLERDWVGGGVRYDGWKRWGKRDGKEDKGKV